MARDRFVKLTHTFVDEQLRWYSGAELKVWLVLKRHENVNTRQCFPSIATIAEKTKLSRQTVINALKSLSKDQIVAIEKRTRGHGKGGVLNSYKL